MPERQLTAEGAVVSMASRSMPGARFPRATPPSRASATSWGRSGWRELGSEVRRIGVASCCPCSASSGWCRIGVH
eukprot:6523176-Alexandrium_andersonii.AAC.1